ncbi:MAG: hypothetical protein ABI939_10745 [Anaerolineaceae bacterium]
MKISHTYSGKQNGKPVNGKMKTTIDLPDALMKEIKLRARTTGRS